MGVVPFPNPHSALGVDCTPLDTIINVNGPGLTGGPSHALNIQLTSVELIQYTFPHSSVGLVISTGLMRILSISCELLPKPDPENNNDKQNDTEKEETEREETGSKRRM